MDYFRAKFFSLKLMLLHDKIPCHFCINFKYSVFVYDSSIVNETYELSTRKLFSQRASKIAHLKEAFEAIGIDRDKRGSKKSFPNNFS